MSSGPSPPVYAVFMVITFVLYCGTVVLNGLYMAGDRGIPDLFTNNPKNMSVKYSLLITPANWTFYIWGVIYLWLGLGLVYGLLTMCFRTDKGPLHVCPPIYTPLFNFFLMLNFCFNITWLFLWDNQHLPLSAVFLFLIAISNCVALAISYSRVFKYGTHMTKQHPAHLWLIRILLHNSLATYTTWSLIASLFNLSIALNYEAGLDQTWSCLVTLISVAALLILWFPLETFVIDRFVRYTITPYMVVIHTMAGIYVKMTKTPDLSKILEEAGIMNMTGVPDSIYYFVLVLLGVSIFLLIFRLAFVIYRHCKRPLFVHTETEEEVPMTGYAHTR